MTIVESRADPVSFTAEAMPRKCGGETACLQQSEYVRRWTAESGGRGYVAHVEPHADYEGERCVFWGATNRMPSLAACAASCAGFVPRAGDIDTAYLPCNTFVFCDQPVCFSRDIHNHTFGECWLKFSELPHEPIVNARGRMPDAIRKQHPTMPELVDWTTGALLPPGVALGRGALKAQ